VTTDPLGVHYRLELSALPVVNRWWHWWEHMAQPLKVGSKDDGVYAFSMYIRKSFSRYDADVWGS
jgi:hypothetical protein